MRILYVTNTRHGRDAWFDPSARHRCYHYADALAAAGHIARVAHLDDVSRDLARKFEHVVFHRPRYDRQFARALKQCASVGLCLHADYDDLLFNPELADSSPLYLNGVCSLSRVRRYYRAYEKAAACFSNIIVSTRYLARQFQTLWPDRLLTIVPNSLPRLFRPPAPAVTDPNYFNLGYFPGSNSHTHDMQMVVEALTRFCKASRCNRIVIAGHAKKPEFARLGDGAVFLPFTDYNHYLTLLATVDVSIAPLVDNVFNRSKSAVKLIESVSVGTPVLVSRNDDMIDHDNPLSTVVDSVECWEDALLASAEEVRTDDLSKVTESLAQRFSVKARLPLLEAHLQCAA